MATFKEQQNKFLANQDFDWGEDDFSDLEDETGGLVEQEKTLQYPSGTCILCQEDTNEHRLYGTFGYISESRLLRQTDLQDDDWIDEVVQTPINLDRPADDIRPFGVSGKNRRTIEKVSATGERMASERQDLGKGFPRASVKPGPVTTGCGHIMHYTCFEAYLQATQRRHVSQIARNHPERPELKEFMCPLCKALGNVFLPVIWKPKKVVHPGALKTVSPFEEWIQTQLVTAYKSNSVAAGKAPVDLTHGQKVLYDYGDREFIQPLASRLPDLLNLSQVALAVPLTSLQQQPRFTVPAFLGVTQDDSQLPGLVSRESSPISQNFPMVELVKVYQRLKDTFRANGIHSTFTYPHTPASAVEDLTHTDSLAQALGNSIAAAEIAQRGVLSVFLRNTLIDNISTQTLTHLRVFSETVSSYIAIGSLRNNVPTKTMEEYLESQRRQARQLFVGHPGIFDPEVLSFDLKHVAPLLCQDPFIFLTECSVGMATASDLDIHHIMRLCYLAEIVRVVYTFLSTLQLPSQSTNETSRGQARFQNPEQFINRDKVDNVLSSPDQLNNLLFFVCMIHNVSAMKDSPASLDIDNMHVPSRFKDLNFLSIIQTMVSTYALPFLRKAAILMHVRYGIELPSTPAEHTDDPELVRLSSLLDLPSLDEIFSSFAIRTPAGHTTRSVVGGWLRHLLWAQAGNVPAKHTISLSHPAIFELVGLPKNYDTLTDEAIRRKCPTTGKELTDPALCLFCGEIMCSQAVCCMTDKHRGGCNQHLAKFVSPPPFSLPFQKTH
jgi:E3 ubiquitin-protein ligase UBR1